MADGVSNHGSTITFEGTAVGDCFVISYPEIAAVEIAYRTHASGAQRKRPSGATTSGDVVISLVAESAVMIAVKAAIAAGTTGEFVIENTVFTMTFDGFYKALTGESADAESPNVLRATVTIAVDGLPTVAATVP